MKTLGTSSNHKERDDFRFFLRGFGLRLLLLGIWFASLAGSLRADTFGDFSFTDTGEAITITGFLTAFPPATVPVQEVQIPAIIKGKPVTIIGTSAFAWQASLKRVTMPASVTQIGNGAFLACQGLTAIIIPEGVVSIGDSAFAGCTWMKSAEFLGNAPVVFGSGVFADTATGFEVRYHNGKSGFTSLEWNGYPAVNIDATPLPLSISTTALAPGNIGMAYSQPLEAEGGAMPRTWSVPSPGSLPPGLSLSADGVISGTPTTAGDFVVPIQVTGSNGVFSTSDFPLKIYAGSVFSITTNATLTVGTVAKTYPSKTLAATGGVSPYTWSVAPGSSLPEGMTLSSYGVISGTPTRAARSTFTVQATDARGVIARKVFSLIIWIEIPTPLPSAVFGSAYNHVLSVTGGVAPRTWALAPGSALPAGLTLADDGTISGTPETTGSFLFTAQVTDSAGFVSAMDLNLAVAAEVTAHLTGFAGTSPLVIPGRLVNATVVAFRQDDLLTPPVVTLTDSLGNFDLGVTGGDWDIYLMANNAAREKNLTSIYGINSSSHIAVSDGQTSSGLRLRPYTIASQSFATVSGKVVDAIGRPVVGVYVRGTGHSYKAIALTDRDGRYWLPYEYDAFEYVDVMAPGYEGKSVSGSLPANAPVINFAPRPVTAHIQGRLTQNGSPLPGAVVGAIASYGSQPYGALRMQTRTDQNGNFDLPVFGGSWFIDALGISNVLFSQGNYSILIYDGETLTGTNINLVTATGTISGCVRDSSGQPVVDAYVDVGSIWTRTDSNGNYSAPVIDGVWYVHVSYSNYDSYDPKYVTVNGTAVADFSPRPVTIAHLRGVVTEGGVPVQGAEVYASGPKSVTTTTDADGAYDLAVEEGSWGVYVYGMSRDVSVTNGQTQSGLDFASPGPGQTISGAVVDSGGAPVSGLGVHASATLGGVRYSLYGYTDAGGNYSISVLDGTWQVNVSSSAPSLTFAGQTANISGGSATLNFASPPAAHITGTVTKDGAPISGFYVGANEEGGDRFEPVATDAGGNYDLTVRAGNWSLYSPGTPFVQSGLTFLVSAGQTISGADIHTFSPTGTISGTLRGADKAPLAQIPVYATATVNGVSVSVSTQTGYGGSYSLPVIDGQWHVQAGEGTQNVFDVTVDVAGSATVVYEAPQPTAHITGRLTKNGVPFPYASVAAQLQGGGWVTAETDSNGNFDLGVRSGAWSVFFSYAPFFAAPIIAQQLPAIAIGDGQTVSGRDIQTFAGTGTISGTVKDANKLPVSGKSVEGTCMVGGIPFAAFGYTGSQGGYSFPVIDGLWTVDIFEQSGDFYSPQTVPVRGSVRVSFPPRVVPASASGGGWAFSNFAGVPGDFTGSADGTGSEAAFSTPSGVAVDASGNIYVSDSGNNLIRKMSSGGVVTTLAGSFNGSADGTGSAAMFSNPQGISVGSAGNIYVAEYDSHRIRKVSPEGEVTSIAGTAGFAGSADGSGATASFNHPADVAVDDSGNVYVADSGNHAIRKIGTDGTVTTFAGNAGAQGSASGVGSNATFSSPQGVAVDAAGNVYVADTANCLIRKITSNGTVSTLAGAAFTGSADRPGRANFTGSADFSGQPSVDGTGTGATFSFPTDIDVDVSGNLFVTDSGTGKIRKITPGGVVTTLGGNPDGFLYNPLGVAVDSTGHLYVADAGNNRIAFGMGTLPVIGTTSPMISGAVGATYSQTLTATGGTEPYTWAVASGTLPAGLALGSNGTLSGKPASATTANFTIRVTGNDSISATADFMLTITSPSATWQGSKFTPEDVLTGRTTMTADFDRDGMANLLEYAFGTNPKTANASGIVPNVSSGKMQISFPRDPAATDITYTVQASPNLSSWADIAESVGGAVTVPINSSGCAVSDTGSGLRTVTVTESSAIGSRRFLRIKVTSP